MTSLFSALSILSGLREYTYRGFQQLPLVLMGISFLFTATTGSVAFLNLFGGMAVVIPIVTFVLHRIMSYLGKKIPGFDFTFSRSDVCGLVPPEGKSIQLYDPKTAGAEPIPSYWLMEVCFFFGFVLSNSIESLTASSKSPDSDAAARRKYHAIFTVAAISTLFVVFLYMRFRYMPSCELRSLSFRGDFSEIGKSTIKALMLLIVFGGISGSIGYGMYTFARKCGARTGDLLGILSQFAPTSAYEQEPIVCARSDDS